MHTRKLYSVAETADALRMGRTKIYDLIKQQDLESVLIGRRRLIKVASIEALIERAGGGVA